MMTIETFTALWDSDEMWAIPLLEINGRNYKEAERYRTLFRQFIEYPGNDAIAKEWRGCGAPRALRLLSRGRAVELYENMLVLRSERITERRRQGTTREVCLNLLGAAKAFHRLQMLPERHTLTKVRNRLAIRCDTCGWLWGIEPGSIDIPMLPESTTEEAS